MDTAAKIGIDRIIATAASQHASDLHLTVGNPPTLRVDRKLIPLTDEPTLTPELMGEIVGQMLPEQQRQILERERELVTSVTLPNTARFRIHFYYSKGYVAISLRLIPETIKTIAELGLPSTIERFAAARHGLILFTGPHGSGRTTTMAAVLQQINRTRSERILTIERPIEFLFVNEQSLVNQQEVGRDTPSVERALVSAIDEDVNVVMLSDLESPAVIALALRAANSGRLVLAAMSSYSSVKAVEQLIDSYDGKERDEARALVADTLLGVISQRLLPRIGGGVVVVAEVLTMTSAVRSIIREGNIYQLHSILQTSREEGMVALDRSLAELVHAGEILLDDALGYANDPANLRAMTRSR